MLEQILKILYENDVPEDIIENTMDALIFGLLDTLSPEEKRQIKLDDEEATA